MAKNNNLSDLLTDVANSIRAKKHTKGTINAQNFSSQIASIVTGIPIHINLHPVGANGWVNDLLSLPLPKNCVYLTIDDSVDNSFVSIRCDSASAITWEIGKIVNGSFVANETSTTTSGQTYQKTFAKLSTYPILKVTSSSDITRFSGETFTSGGRTRASNESNFIERVANISHWDSQWANINVIREKTIFFGNVTNLGNVWSGCYSLQTLDLSGWNTTNWNVTSLSYTWYGCTSLQTLDLSGWGTSNWNVANLYGTWFNCYSLQLLDLSGWDTSNWNITNMNTAWFNCYSLQTLDLSGWNTTNWNVTSLTNTWQNCNSLTKPKISPMLTLGATTYPLNACFFYTPQNIIDIFNQLPTITTSKTLTLGSANLNKLTSDEKAIATNKGWTLA